MPAPGESGWYSRIPVAGDVLSAAEGARDAFGMIEDAVTVTVRGNPRAKKNTLYFLAAATAFGMVKRLTASGYGFTTPPGMIMLEHDAAEASVTFHLMYRQSYFTSSILDPTGIFKQLPVFTGPGDTVVGGVWQYRPFGDLLRNPRLPFSDKTIITNRETVINPDPNVTGGAEITTPHPRPSGDGRSRGSLIRFVQAALADPTSRSKITFPLPTDPDRFAGK